jgi:hypothetical protein
MSIQSTTVGFNDVHKVSPRESTIAYGVPAILNITRIIASTPRPAELHWSKLNDTRSAKTAANPAAMTRNPAERAYFRASGARSESGLAGCVGASRAGGAWVAISRTSR